MSWWDSAVVYQVYVRSFADSNGDGIGDLPGIRARLGHLVELGVDALWLTPFYPSPQVDGGYDISDHRGVDPLFGTLADFDALVADAHRAGLRVLVDLVPNHTSDQHPWFRDHPDRYHVRAERPNNWRSLFGGSAWEPLGDGRWYLHVFGVTQPDLNWTNPAVASAFDEILRFWLDRGVDGFRVDAAGALAKDMTYADTRRGRPHPFSDRPAVHAVYERWRPILDAYGVVGVAEAWGAADVVAPYVAPGRLHQVFAIDVLLAEAKAPVLRRRIDAMLAAVGERVAWVLGNHDLPRPVTRYGPDLARGMHLLTLALPGALYLHQGDELGLPDVALDAAQRRDNAAGASLRSRDGARVPLPWTSSPAAPSWLPQPAGWGGYAPPHQRADPSSMLSLLTDAIRVRRTLWAGSLRWLPAAPGCLAFARRGATCVLNLSTRPVRLDRYPGEVLLASAPVVAGRLPAHACAWLTAPTP